MWSNTGRSERHCWRMTPKSLGGTPEDYFGVQLGSSFMGSKEWSSLTLYAPSFRDPIVACGEGRFGVPALITTERTLYDRSF